MAPSGLETAVGILGAALIVAVAALAAVALYLAFANREIARQRPFAVLEHDVRAGHQVIVRPDEWRTTTTTTNPGAEPPPERQPHPLDPLMESVIGERTE